MLKKLEDTWYMNPQLSPPSELVVDVDESAAAVEALFSTVKNRKLKYYLTRKSKSGTSIPSKALETEESSVIDWKAVAAAAAEDRRKDSSSDVEGENTEEEESKAAAVVTSELLLMRKRALMVLRCASTYYNYRLLNVSSTTSVFYAALFFTHLQGGKAC